MISRKDTGTKYFYSHWNPFDLDVRLGEKTENTAFDTCMETGALAQIPTNWVFQIDAIKTV